jgi:hypothetical protein
VGEGGSSAFWAGGQLIENVASNHQISIRASVIVIAMLTVLAALLFLSGSILGFGLIGHSRRRGIGHAESGVVRELRSG